MNLQEQINFEVAKVLLELRTGFDIRKFKAMDDYHDQFEYAQSKLELLGEGSSRAVFLLSNRTVLKMAGPPKYPDAHAKGQGQNEAEVEAYTNPEMRPVLTKIFDFDHKNYNWIISELVRPLEYKEFFEEIGIEDNMVFVRAREISSTTDSPQEAKRVADYEVEMAEKRLEDALVKLKIAEDMVANNGDKKETLDDKIELSFARKKVKLMEKRLQRARGVRAAFDNKFFLLLHELEDKFEILFGDTRKHEHWGKTADGRIVLLDYGFTEDVYSRYY